MSTLPIPNWFLPTKKPFFSSNLSIFYCQASGSEDLLRPACVMLPWACMVESIFPLQKKLASYITLKLYIEITDVRWRMAYPFEPMMFLIASPACQKKVMLFCVLESASPTEGWKSSCQFAALCSPCNPSLGWVSWGCFSPAQICYRASHNSVDLFSFFSYKL